MCFVMVTFLKIKVSLLDHLWCGGFLVISGQSCMALHVIFICPAFVWGNANANAHSLTPLAALTLDLVQTKLAARNVAA